jgi:Uma2 family endonuclease
MTEPAERLSVDDYFALDAASERKVEYYDGQTIAMAGASPRHNRLSLRVGSLLDPQLTPRGCFVAVADQRVRLIATEAWVYPDVVASCHPEFTGPKPKSLLTPELVVEVLSETTELHDRSAKLSHYRLTPSIREIVFVHASERLIEHHRRVNESTWTVTLIREGEVPMLDAKLSMDAIYEGVDALPEE